MSRTPDLAEIVNGAIAAAFDGLEVSAPGRVVAYDAATQRADVQPLIKRRHYDELGNLVSEQLPVIPSVPVAFQGGGGMSVTFPIQVGDPVFLVFAGGSMDKWAEASADQAVDPDWYARHSLADAVAIPGLRNARNARPSPPADHVRIGTDSGSAQGAGLGEATDVYVRGVTGTPATDPTCLHGFITAVATALSLTPPSAPSVLKSATVKVTP